VSDPQEPSRATNPLAAVSVTVALLALVLGLFVRIGAALGVVAVVLAVGGLARAEKTDVGLAAALFGLAFGLLAVVWTAMFVVSGT
jgi:hypothetical protein